MPQIKDYNSALNPTGAEFVITQTAAGTTEKVTLANVANQSDNRGWSMTHDNQYTQGSPLTVSNGSRVKLTNNGGGVLTDNSQMPVGLLQTEFYNTTTDIIDPPNNLGDVLNYRITLQAKPSTANVVGTIEFQIEDAPVIVTGITTLTFPDNSERGVQLYTSTFVLQNFIDNKAGIYVSASGGSIEIYDFKILVERGYVGR